MPSQPPAAAPPDLLHRRLRLFSLIFTAALIIAAFTIYGFRLEVSRGAIFRIAMGLLLACNVLWWTFADKCLLSGLPHRPRLRRALRGALAALVATLAAPLAAMLVGGRMWPLLRAAPWAVGAFQIWHMFLGLALPLAATLVYSALGIRWFYRRLRGMPAPALAPSPSRRDFLRAAAIYSPLVVTAGATAMNRRSMAAIEINRRLLPAPWLPDRLRGLTLTHLSDLHVGRLFRPDQLPRVVDDVNRLDSDLILVTGDIVDLSNDMLPPAIDALNQLRHRHGLFLCLGNHDLIDDRAAFIDAVRAAGFPLLINQRRRLRIGGESITIAGLDWASSLSPHRAPSASDGSSSLSPRERDRVRAGSDSRSPYRAPSASDGSYSLSPSERDRVRADSLSPGERARVRADQREDSSPPRSDAHLDHARQMLRGYDPNREGPCITLAHHPHAFDVLAALGIPLTLSGHTHGGQLMFSPPDPHGHGDPARDRGVGRLLFRYLRGFYHQSGSTLFVNRGIGNWFPVRINAPAEIVQIQLT